MRTLLYALLLFCPALISAQSLTEKYPVDSASLAHAGVPKGEILHFTFENSKIYPGTSREYWVYVPAQYNPTKPACVFVDQDGIQFNAPVVFDNLINNKQMPVTIGVFVQPGRVKAANANLALDRFNRSFEYDGLGDAYARFILNEVLPEVEKQKTSDGRAIVLSKSSNDRAIGGSSSGAICAFNAAWERPDAFSRVFSSIGTYVSLRGADRLPSLIRKYEPKALRVFLQDGTHDLNIYAGDWHLANQMMLSALSFSGYEVEHVWGEGAHNGIHATAIFPQAMRWLWKDYPKPVSTGATKNAFLNDILYPNEGWELVGSGYGFTEGLGANAAGEIFYQDIPNSKTYKVTTDGKLTALTIDAKKASGTAFGPDGNRYTTGSSNQVLCYDENSKVKIIADSIAGNDIVIGKNGNMYVTAPNGSEKPSKIYLIKPSGEKSIVDQGLRFANGITFTPDQSQIYITESNSHWVWIYNVQPDGKLTNKQRYGWLSVPDNAEVAWPDGIRCDHDGRVYVATNMGIQILDQTGRVNAILPLPITHGQPSNLYFGGPKFNVLYVTCNDKVFRRKVKVTGANAFEEPIKPAKPRL